MNGIGRDGQGGHQPAAPDTLDAQHRVGQVAHQPTREQFATAMSAMRAGADWLRRLVGHDGSPSNAVFQSDPESITQLWPFGKVRSNVQVPVSDTQSSMTW